MEAKQKFLQIKQYKYSRDPAFDETVKKYLKKTIENVKALRTCYLWSNVSAAKDLQNIAGVYLIFLENQDGTIVFTYIGETTNLYRRWQQHVRNLPVSRLSLYKKMRKKIGLRKNWEDHTYFVALEKGLNDENLRLYRETYNIYKFKTRNYALNTKNCSRRLKCPDGHGMCRTWLSYHVQEGKVKLDVYAKSRNKLCQTTFLIS